MVGEFQWGHLARQCASSLGDEETDARVKRLWVEGQILEPRIEPDPWWRALSILFPIIEDPFGFARRALEKCLSCRNSADSIRVRNEIAEEFYASRLQQHALIRCIAPDDVSTIEDHSTRLIVSSTPTIEHVRRGMFWERERHIRKLRDIIDSEIDDTIDRPSNSIGVIWIQGRSGSGKSILLLQAMKFLVESGMSVIWLGNNTSVLSTIITQLNSCAGDRSQPDLIFIDDFYDPQAWSEIDLRKIVSTVVHGGFRRWPIIVTCGASEFRDALERDCAAEGFQVRPYLLEPLDPRETSELVRWYTTRYGEPVLQGAAVAQNEALVISVTAELRYGDLRPFAFRFSRRLKSAGVLEALRFPLALNRLYILTPTAWFSLDELNRLEIMNQDGDFELITAKSRGRYLRLSHPHLSDAIYRVAFGHQTPRSIGSDLVGAFERSLENDFTTSVRIMNAIASGNARTLEAEPSTLASGMIKVLRKNTDIIGSYDKYDLAFFWTSWAKWRGNTFHISTFTADYDFVSLALEAMRLDHPYWPTLWTQLWESEPRRPQLEQSALTWLRGHLRDSRWHRPWAALFESIETSSSQNEVAELAFTIVRLDPRSISASRVLSILVARRKTLKDAAIFPLTSSWLKHHPDLPTWDSVWMVALNAAVNDDLYELSADLWDIGRDWLSRNENSEHWAQVLEVLLRKCRICGRLDHMRVLTSHAKQWIERYPDHSNAPLVRIEVALTTGDRAIFEEVVGYTVSWLRSHPVGSLWFFVWRRIFDGLGRQLPAAQRIQIYQIGIVSLRATYLPFERSELWRCLFAAHLREPALPIQDLDEIGLAILADLSTPNWGAVFSHILRWINSGTDDEIVNSKRRALISAANWLKAKGEIAGMAWLQVFRQALGAGLVPDRNLITRGLVVLRHSNRKAAGYLAGTLLLHADDDFHIREIANLLNIWFSDVTQTGGSSVWRIIDVVVNEKLKSSSIPELRNLRSMLDRWQPPSVKKWKELRFLFETRSILVGRVVKSVRIKGGFARGDRLGAIVDIGVNAFLPIEQAQVAQGTEPRELIGQEVEVVIVSMDDSSGRIDVSQKAVAKLRT